MWKASVWGGLGSGFAMGAAAVLFDAKWLLICAAVCFAIAAVAHLREKRRKAPSEPKPSGSGIFLAGCENAIVSDNVVEGYGSGIVDIGGRGNRHENNTVMGDSYTNTGTNYGHIGPVNQGRQEYELTDEAISEIVSRIPSGRDVVIQKPGTTRGREMGQRLRAAVERAGFKVARDRELVIANYPQPLTETDNGREYWITISPEA